MMLMVLGALIGLWLGGATGLVLGATVGYLVQGFARSAAQRRLRGVQGDFLETTFAVMGALCKADGVVTRDEIQAVEAMFSRLNLSTEQREVAKSAFSRGKAPDFDLDRQVQLFAQSVGTGNVLVQLFLQLQLMAVAADGQIHPAERAMLVRVAQGLGLSELDVARLEALLRAAGAGPGQTYDPRGSASAPPARDRVADAYSALGLTPDATEAEIKRTYRRMISETHPDRMASQGLPQNMRDLAEERAREINAAYDVIKRARNFA